MDKTAQTEVSQFVLLSKYYRAIKRCVRSAGHVTLLGRKKWTSDTNGEKEMDK